MTVSLSGRAALVTGVSRPHGIGAAIARRLAAEGASLYLTGWPPHDEWSSGGEGGPEWGRQLCDELRQRGVRVDWTATDLADPAAPSELIAAAVDSVGPLDILVANHARSANQSLLELTAAELDLCFAVNARATLLLVRHFAEQHGRAEGGRVVTVTSGQYHDAMPGELPYIASKAAVQQLTRSLAVDLSRRRITVNSVDPGPNDTGWPDATLRDRIAQAIPLGGWGRPEETARLVAWLCGDNAGWITGQTIASDGGWSSLGSSAALADT